MAGSKKARVRSLERRIGTVGTDPFIPARQPHPVAAAASAVPLGRTRPRRWRVAWAWARLVAGIALAGAGVWGAFFASPALAASVRQLGGLPSGASMVVAQVLAVGVGILGLGIGVWGIRTLRRARLAADIDAL